MAVFAVTTAKDTNWDGARDIREQPFWEEHAAFADALVDRGPRVPDQGHTPMAAVARRPVPVLDRAADHTPERPLCRRRAADARGVAGLSPPDTAEQVQRPDRRAASQARGPAVKAVAPRARP